MLREGELSLRRDRGELELQRSRGRRDKLRRRLVDRRILDPARGHRPWLGYAEQGRSIRNVVEMPP